MKKIFALILTATMLFAMVLPCFAVSIPVFGDANTDGGANSKDLTRLMKFISGEDVKVRNADLNYDNVLNSKDLTRLMKYISGEKLTPVNTDPFAELEDIELSVKLSSDFDRTSGTDINMDELLASIMANLGGTPSEPESAAAADLSFQFTGNTTYPDNSSSITSFIGRLRVNSDDNGMLDQLTLATAVSMGDNENVQTGRAHLAYNAGTLFVMATDEEINEKFYIEADKIFGPTETPDGGNGDAAIPGISDIDPETLEAISSFITKLAEKVQGKVYNTANGQVIEFTLDKNAFAELITEIAPPDAADTADIPEINVSVCIFVTAEGELIGLRADITTVSTLAIDESTTETTSEAYELLIAVNATGRDVVVTLPSDLEDYTEYVEEPLPGDDLYTAVLELYDENGNKVENYDELYTALCDTYTKEAVDEVIANLEYGIAYSAVIETLYNENGERVENFDEAYTKLCELYNKEAVDAAIADMEYNIVYSAVTETLYNENGERVENFDEAYAKLCELYNKEAVDAAIADIEYSIAYSAVIETLYNENGERVENFDTLYAELCEKYDAEVIDSIIEDLESSWLVDDPTMLIVGALFDCNGTPVENYDEVYADLVLEYSQELVDEAVAMYKEMLAAPAQL